MSNIRLCDNGAKVWVFKVDRKAGKDWEWED